MTDHFLRFLARSNSWSPGRRLALAVAIVTLATGVRLSLSSELGTRFLTVTYYPAVAIATMTGGVASGVAAALLSAATIHLVFGALFDTTDLVGAAAFLAGSSVIVVTSALLQTGRSRLAEADAARSSAEQLGQFVALAPVALAMFDRDMCYIATSQRWLSEHGLDDRELVGLSHYDVFPEIPEAWRKVHRRALSGETVRAEEDRLVRAGFSEQWMRWEVRPWRRADGDIGGIIIFSEDITGRKKAEQEADRTGALFRAMFENANIGMAQLTPDAKWLRVNARLCEITGYAADELTTRSFLDITHPEDVATELDQATRIFTGEIDSYKNEKRYIRKDGSVAWVNIYVRGIRDADGKVRNGVKVVEDISERKRAEDAIRKFSRVIEQTASTVVITDANGVIEYVNPRFAEISGYTPEEAIGKKPSILKSGHTSDAEYAELWRTITGGGVWRGEFRNRHKDGSLYWEAATISPIRDAAGRITHFAAVKHDITRRKEIESQLAVAHRMEAIGRLADGIAHDFNNLLAVIAGNLELIKQRSSDPAVQTLVRPALEATEAGAAFNRRLLSLGGKRRFEPKPLVVNDRIQETRGLLERGLGAQIVLHYDLVDDPWPSIADPGEIDSCLLNLVSNSRDAMPRGGDIVIETRNVTVDADEASRLSGSARAGDFVRISVIDDGEGMRKEVLEQALEPFFTTKAEGKGTGLGLSGVDNFVRQAGGFVTIETREGDGATVSLYLPRALVEIDAAQPVAPQDTVPMGDGEVILVVDDDDRVRDVTLNRVEALGYVVESAQSGAEAVELLKSRVPVDLVLSDIVMPGGMSGYELARWLRSEAPSVKIVLATGFGGQAASAGQVALDAPVLHKPYTRQQLAEALAGALGKQAQTIDTSLAKT